MPRTISEIISETLQIFIVNLIELHYSKIKLLLLLFIPVHSFIFKRPFFLPNLKSQWRKLSCTPLKNHKRTKHDDRKCLNRRKSRRRRRRNRTNSRKNRTADDRLIEEQAEQQRSVYGGPGWIPTCADPLAKDPQTRRDARLISAAWPAAVRVGSFIRTLVTARTTPPEKSLFSPFSPSPRPFETCEENDGGRERCSPLISPRFENVWHVPRPCNAWIVQGVVVCEVECCFDTEGVILRGMAVGERDARSI